jgi:3-oxoacyl-[acyl-carrier-protein] synthase II
MDKSDIRRTDLFSQYAHGRGLPGNGRQRTEKTVEPERFGVYFGSGVGGLITVSNEMQVLLEKGPKRVSPFFIPMMIANIAAGNIAIRFNAQGSCLPVTTACATSTSAIGEAYRAIRYGYADAILAGGSEAAITPLGVAGFTNCMALTTSEDPEAASIPFDKRRSGFVMERAARL